MGQKRIGTDKGVDLQTRKNVLKVKHKGKTKKEINTADVIEYVKEIMANDIGLTG